MSATQLWSSVQDAVVVSDVDLFCFVAWLMKDSLGQRLHVVQPDSEGHVQFRVRIIERFRAC